MGEAIQHSYDNEAPTMHLADVTLPHLITWT